MIALILIVKEIIKTISPAVFVIGCNPLSQYYLHGSLKKWFWCACSVGMEKPKEITRHPFAKSDSKICRHGTMAGVISLII